MGLARLDGEVRAWLRGSCRAKGSHRGNPQTYSCYKARGLRQGRRVVLNQPSDSHEEYQHGRCEGRGYAGDWRPASRSRIFDHQRGRLRAGSGRLGLGTNGHFCDWGWLPVSSSSHWLLRSRTNREWSEQATSVTRIRRGSAARSARAQCPRSCGRSRQGRIPGSP